MKSSTWLIGFLVTVIGGVSSAEIPEGFEVVRITDDPQFFDNHVRLNNCGVMVLATRLGGSWRDAEIFVYDNGKITRLTSNRDRDVSPDINDRGVIVWSRGEGDTGAHEVVRRFRGDIQVVSEPSMRARGGALNNVGRIVWCDWLATGCQKSNADAITYDDPDSRRLTNNDASNQSEELNDSDLVVWTRFDFCPSQDWESHIMLHEDDLSMRLTDGQTRPTAPHVNNVGQVVWGGPDGLDSWEAGVTTRLTDWGRAPRINDHGDVLFLRWHEDVQTWHTWLLRDGTFLQLSTDDSIWHDRQDINNDGEAVWTSGGFPNNDVYYMRRIRTGDSEFDGDIDVDDLAKLVDCMTGPMWVERANPGPEDSLCECRFLDINHDGSVDLRDYAIFQQNFGQ